MENDTTLSAANPGEARHKARQKALLRWFGMAMVAGFVAGMVGGFAGALVADGLLPVPVLIGLWALTVALFIWFSRDFYRRIDEVDLIDNLWASTVAFYAYTIVFGSWYVFHDIGLIGPPQQLTIFNITIAAGIVAYGARKLGWR